MKSLYKNIILCLSIGSFVFLIGCEDETPFPTTYEGETVFKVDGQLDNDALQLEAGKDNFYMYTDYELNNQNILELSGAFQKNDLCTDVCEEKLKIIINNNQLGLDFVLDSALYIGNYNLEPTIITGNSQYIVNFTPEVTGATPTSYLWFFEDTIINTSVNPTYTYTNQPIFGHIVSLEANTSVGQKSRYTNTIFDLNAPPVNCSFDIDYNMFFDSVQGSYNYTVWVEDPLANPFLTAYIWEINFVGQGTYTDSSLVDTITFTTPPNANQFEICVHKLSNTCITSMCKDFNTQGTIDFSVSFNYDVESIITPGDSTFFSVVTIEYTTPDGIFYSSKLGSQVNSTFEILSIFDHDNNERNQNTKKIEAAVNCKLYNQDGSSLDFISNELIFGISIPE